MQALARTFSLYLPRLKYLRAVEAAAQRPRTNSCYEVVA